MGCQAFSSVIFNVVYCIIHYNTAYSNTGFPWFSWNGGYRRQQGHLSVQVMNGLALCKLRPFGSTFLVFSDYMTSGGMICDGDGCSDHVAVQVFRAT